jgi:O-acetyl-ADP-ribose deacetylase (regulator of RNase III)
MSYALKIKQGNLLIETDSTFIVNASNTKLLLGSGVSMAFKHHCVNELQKEMTAKLDEIGLLKKGDVVATSSAKANNFKYALHVAVMDYNQGVRGDDKLPTLQDIKNSLINIKLYLEWYIDKSNSKNMKLVLPLMGCGVGGLDKADVINLYKKHFENNINFDCKVVVYGFSKDDYEMLQQLV